MVSSKQVPLSEAYWFQEGPGVRNWQFTTSGVKLLNVGNITKDGTIDLDKTDKHISLDEAEGKYSHFLVDEGDLVIASSGISFDEDGMLRTRGAFIEKKHLPLCLNTSTIRFKAIDGVSDLNFFKFWLDSFEFRDQVSRLVTGSAQQNFGPSHLKAINISLPPLTEQKRIASLLARADRLRHLRRTAHDLGESLLQSVFLEMFGDPQFNEKKWDLVTLGEKITFMTSGSRGWAEYYSDKGDLFLRIQNVGANQLLLDDVAYVQAPDTVESKRTRVQPGDLLISATADLGRTAVIPENFPTAYINQHLFLLRLKDLNPVFIAGYYSTQTGKAQILRLDREGVKSGLNFDDVRSLTVFNPPLSLQEEFAGVVARVEGLRARQAESERQVENLFESLLAESFDGVA